MRTGKGRSEGQAFHRRLLSEYNTEITLDNYVSYFELKPIAKDVERLREKIKKYQEEIIGNTNTNTNTKIKTGTTAIITLETSNINEIREVETEIPKKVILEELIAKREQKENEFFAQLHASFVKVKNYLYHLECDLTTQVQELKALTEEEIRARPEQHIPKLYIKVQSILQYRALNLAAFRKIMKKFMERCACDSLQLQKRLLAVDEVIFRSALSQPRLDLRRIALDLIALYGTVYRLTYEETVGHLSQFEHKAGVNIRRILPHSDTFFFTLNFPHQEKQGHFAVRILPGNTSLFCEKMICEVLQCERYPPCCSQFPNGEINVVLSKTLRGDDVFILQSLVKCEHLHLSHSGALMELALMLHTARLSSSARITAVIPYLAYTGSVSSMAMIAELLETMGCQHIITVDMNIEQVEGMFSIPLENISARYEFVRYLANHLTNEGHDFRNITVVAPTGSSVGRARHFADALMRYKKLSPDEQFVSVCTAVHRQLPTGNNNNNNVNNNNVNTVSFSCLTPAAGAHFTHSPTAREQANIINNNNNNNNINEEEEEDAVNTSSGSSICAGFNKSTDAEVAAHTSIKITNTATNLEEKVSSEALVTPVDNGNTMKYNNNNNNIQKRNPRGLITPHNINMLTSPTSELSSCQHEVSSTFAFEKALRQQESGINSIRNIPIDTTMSTEGVALVGDVKDRLCIIIDTCIDEAINICRTALKLREAGANRIILIATHFIISGKAVERLTQSPIDLVVVTDSVDQDEVFKNPQFAQKLRVLPIAPLLARAIEKMHTENSLATLFEN